MNKEEALALKHGDVVYLVNDVNRIAITVEENYIYGEFITYSENGGENMVGWSKITKH